MNESQIRAVLKVAELGSITKAAGALWVSPQGLKGQIDVLERELCCKLFERTNHGMALTAEGETFCSGAPALLEHLSGLIRSVQRAGGGMGLRLLIPAGKRVPILDEICAAYRREYPEIEVTFCAMSGARAFDNVLNGLADVGFFVRNVAVLDVQGLELSPCGIKMGWRCVVSPDHPLARLAASSVRLDDLLPYDLAAAVSYETTVTDRIPHCELVAYDRYAIISRCANGGVCICDEYLAEEFSQLSTIEIVDFDCEIVIGHRPGRSYPVEAFVEVAREVISTRHLG